MSVLARPGGVGWAAAVLVFYSVGAAGCARSTTPQASSPVDTARGDAPAGSAAQELRLQRLKTRAGPLAAPERDPFRFKPKPPPPPPRPVPAPVLLGPPAPVPPPPPPPPPPIPLKFIGLVDTPSKGGRLAVLSDVRGNILYGKEGDIIEGQYRVLRIGVESAELAYLDGRGRQVIRLSGQ